jgi:cytochrome c-type biogenesis protein CcmH/NrfG
MSRQPVFVGGRADATEFRKELLGRLGLGDDASDQDVEEAHNGLVDFLELAPHDVKSWATARTTDVDEAFALLSGPEQDLIPPAAVALANAQEGLDETPPPTAATPATARPVPAVPATPGRRWPQRTQLVWAIVPVLVLAVVLGVYWSGKDSVPGINGTPTNAATSAAPAGAKAVDPAKVGALMKKISANPKDTVSLLALGDLYFGASDFKNAALWEQKVLDVDPKNESALLGLGAANFNLGNAAEAKKTWLVAAGLYPKSAVVHYDLGFLYFSQTPPDKVNMTAEWKKVIAIDPNSELAKTVATHIKAPTATATPGAK